ncbi:hypothetical protein C0J52_20839 [Blattella germanica]|nr:hypothetical protein C0J52_20839 [Blattella germanica]
MSKSIFDLFPKLKEPMHGRRNPSLEELSTTVTQTTRQMNENGVLDGIILLPRRWDSIRGTTPILKDCEEIQKTNKRVQRPMVHCHVVSLSRSKPRSDSKFLGKV